MKQYLSLLKHVLDNGNYIPKDQVRAKVDGQDVGKISTFGERLEFDISESFPLVTTKKVYWKGIVHELLWFISGNSNIRYLLQNDVHIWTDWPYENYIKSLSEDSHTITKEYFEQKILSDKFFAHRWGSCGPIYGKQWRQFGTEDSKEVSANSTRRDQLLSVIDSIISNPHSTRHLVTAWNPAQLDQMALPPCHVLFQFYVRNLQGTKYLDCQLYQRSADLFLGVPFNIASYALLTYMIAHVTGTKPGRFIHVFGDCHVYGNQIEQVEEQLRREERDLPKVELSQKIDNIEEFTYDDISLVGYDPHPAIKAKVAV